MDKTLYINKKIKLYPNAPYSNFGIITNVDELGFMVKITKADPKVKTYATGNTYFISHSTAFNFAFVD